jgi:hypothetical protein
MDEQRFDNIARSLAILRSRRGALKTAGFGTVAAVFSSLGPQKSALADFNTEHHCKEPGVPCGKKTECCGFTRKRPKETVCKPITGLDGPRCCGQARASCFEDQDCCQLYECNLNTFECQLIP